MLTLSNISVTYGGVIKALQDVSLEVREGEIVCLLGANGAGKTSTLKSISGLVPIRGGTVSYNGETISGKQPDDIVKTGIIHVPEGRRIFPGLTVRENLDVATTPWRKRGMSAATDLERVFEIFPVLKERSQQLGWSLSGGEQQMLAIGRALMSHPKVLLLDEPSLGLAPLVVAGLFKIIQKINMEQKIPIMLVEQNAKMALRISKRGYVLQNGVVVMSGSSEDLINDEGVQKAYLGGE